MLLIIIIILLLLIIKMIRPATDAKPDSTAAVSTESLAPETEAETVAAESTVYRTTDTVNVRPEPSTDTDRICLLYTSILALLDHINEEVNQENSNKNPVINSTQRDYMAGEVSKDLSKRVLLPEEIVRAHEEGIIHFHDTDYFAQKEHNCDLINLEAVSSTQLDVYKRQGRRSSGRR